MTRIRLLPEDRFLGLTPYLWLGYFPTLFVALWLSRASASQWWVTIGAGAVFLVLYFSGYWARPRELMAIIVAIAALGFALMPRNPGAMVLITYAAAFAGVLRPARRAVLAMLVLAASVAVAGLAGMLRSPWWQFEIFLLLMIGFANVHFTQVRDMNDELQRARADNENLVRVAERERIGRDLHDVLGHTLTLITLKSALAARIAESSPRLAADEMRGVEQVSRGALGEIRAALAGVRDVGLAHEVASAATMLRAAGVEVQHDVDPVPLSRGEDAALAMVVREAVTNVVRHAGATHCRISLTVIDGVRALAIADDGRGKQGPDGSGLAGMRERVRSLGGDLIVASLEPAGTRVLITLSPAPS